MKTLAAILLSFTIAAHLMGRFIPVPFFGWAVGFLAFPLALRLSWRQLFLMEMAGLIFGVCIQFDSLISQYSVGASFFSTSFPGESNFQFYSIVFWITMAALIPVAAALQASCLKLLSRFTPRRFRFIVEGNP